MHQNTNQLQNNIIGLDKGLSTIYKTILTVAQYNINILLIGETGTGKELFANCIHELSNFNSGNMIKINCAAMPDHLLESELFGYERGAFTGASQTKKGKIELAHNGTLFLDEIGEIKLELQAKLLRVLQTQEITRVGSNQPIKLNFRLIGATNRNLINAVKEGSFREDLYYRISTFPITIPPLRERTEDIEALIDHLCEQICLKTDLKQKKIESKAMKYLKEYNWPGNIRELENVLLQLLIHSQNEKKITHILISGILKKNISTHYDQAISEIMLSLVHKKNNLKNINSDIINALFNHFHHNVNQIQENTSFSRDMLYRFKRKLSYNHKNEQ